MLSTDILSSSRRLRRKKTLIKAALVMSGILCLAGLIVVFLNLPKFRISGISLEGNRIIHEGELYARVREIIGRRFLIAVPLDNILIFQKEKIYSELSRQFPVLKKIEIKRNFPNRIIILIEERKPYALWCKYYFAEEPQSTARKCAFIDDSGFIFSPAPDFSGNIFLKFLDARKEAAEIGRLMLEEAEFKKLIVFYNLAAKKNFLVKNIRLKDSGFYEVYLKEGWYVILNNKNEPVSSFENLELVLEETVKEKRPKLEYIDLRFGKKVFFKLR